MEPPRPFPPPPSLTPCPFWLAALREMLAEELITERDFGALSRPRYTELGPPR